MCGFYMCGLQIPLWWQLQPSTSHWSPHHPEEIFFRQSRTIGICIKKNCVNRSNNVVCGIYKLLKWNIVTCKMLKCICRDGYLLRRGQCNICGLSDGRCYVYCGTLDMQGTLSVERIVTLKRHWIYRTQHTTKRLVWHTPVCWTLID